MKVKLITRAIIIVLVSFLIISTASSQSNDWRSYFTGNNINVLAEQNDNVWLGTNGGGLFYYSKLSKQYLGNIAKSVNGLPDMFINAIRVVGDTLFIGTNNGFTIYDKVNFKTYKTYNSGLPNNKINTIDVDVFGGRWIGTDSGLAVLQGRTWTVYTTANSGLPSNKITYIRVENTGAKWIGTDNGLVKFNGVTWENFNTENSGIAGNYINFITFNNSGAKLIGTRSGLSILFGLNWGNFNTSNSGIPGDNVTSLAYDKDNFLWVSTENGFAKQRGSKFDVTDQSNAPLSTNFIKYLLIDKDDSKWLATPDSLNIQFGTTLAKRNVNITQLRTNEINSVNISNTGTAWISTANGAPTFNGNTWFYIIATKDYDVRQTIFDKDNNAWLATDKGVVKISGFTVTVYNSESEVLPTDDIRALAFDRNGNLWVGSAAGLIRYNGFQWDFMKPAYALIPDLPISSLAIEGASKIWIGTNNGLRLFDGLSSWTTYNQNNSEIPDNFITSIAIDPNDIKWIGTRDGLARFDEVQWSTFNISNSAIAQNRVTSIAVDLSGKIWVGTYTNGISVLNTDNTFSNLNVDNSALSDNHINSLKTDLANNIWISTNCGLLVHQQPDVLPSTYITGYSTNICAGKNMPVTIQTLYKFATDNRFTVELSDTMGGFGTNPMAIGSNVGSGNNSTIIAFLPKNLVESNTYRIRIKSSNPVFTSNPSDFIMINSLPKLSVSGRASVCFNSITSYSVPDDESMQYDWRLINGSFYVDSVGNSITVNWSNSQTTGIVRLILTNGNGCKDTTDYNVKISNHPNTSIAGKLGVCADNSYLYEAKSDPTIRYTWFATGGNIYSLSDHNKAWVKWGNPGVGSLKLIAVTADGCIDSTTITINILSAPTAKINGSLYGEQNITSTYTTPLTPPNILKKWHSINGEIIGSDTSSNVQIKWKNYGFGYVIQVQTSPTGCKDSNTYMVKIFQSINAEGYRDVCEERIEYYSAASNLGANNLWTVTGGVIQGANNQRVIPVKWGTAATGHIRLVQWVTGAPYRDTVDFDVIIHVFPEKPRITEKNDTLYSSSPTGNQWLWEDQYINGANDNKYYTSKIAGTYTLKVITAPWCISPLSDGFDFASPVEEPTVIRTQFVSIYPNPSTGIFNLVFNESSNSLITYRVIDNLGRTIIDNIQSENQKIETVDLSSYPSGTYQLIVNNGINQFVQKLILNK